LKQFIYIFFIACTSSVFAQDFSRQFNELYQKKDSIAEIKLLREWRAAAPQDPEIYVAWFNYYVQLSRKDIVTITSEQSYRNTYIIKDSTGKDKAFINEEVVYNRTLLNRAIDSIDHGIIVYPSRLDMRFAKINMLNKTYRYDEFAREIIKAVNYGATINNNWLWTNNEARADAKEFFLGTIQGYVEKLYKSEDDKQLGKIQQIAETILKYYPDNVEAISDIAVTHIFKNEYEEALALLHKAESISPHNNIVLNNMARCYALKNDKPNAIKYYKLLVLYGNNDDKRYGEQQIGELERN